MLLSFPLPHDSLTIALTDRHTCLLRPFSIVCNDAEHSAFVPAREGNWPWSSLSFVPRRLVAMDEQPRAALRGNWAYARGAVHMT